MSKKRYTWGGLDLLFCYGILMEGQTNHDTLGPNAELVAREAWTEDKYYMYNIFDAFPAIEVPGKISPRGLSPTIIHGELWRVPDVQAQRLIDEQRGFPEDMFRRPINVRYEKLGPMDKYPQLVTGETAFLYTVTKPFPEPKPMQVQSGNWKNRNVNVSTQPV